jgi:hypothetical protein
LWTVASPSFRRAPQTAAHKARNTTRFPQLRVDLRVWLHVSKKRARTATKPGSTRSAAQGPAQRFASVAPMRCRRLQALTGRTDVVALWVQAVKIATLIARCSHHLIRLRRAPPRQIQFAADASHTQEVFDLPKHFDEVDRRALPMRFASIGELVSHQFSGLSCARDPNCFTENKVAAIFARMHQDLTGYTEATVVSRA